MKQLIYLVLLIAVGLSSCVSSISYRVYPDLGKRGNAMRLCPQDRILLKWGNGFLDENVRYRVRAEPALKNGETIISGPADTERGFNLIELNTGVTKFILEFRRGGIDTDWQESNRTQVEVLPGYSPFSNSSDGIQSKTIRLSAASWDPMSDTPPSWVGMYTMSETGSEREEEAAKANSSTYIKLIDVQIIETASSIIPPRYQIEKVNTGFGGFAQGLLGEVMGNTRLPAPAPNYSPEGQWIVRRNPAGILPPGDVDFNIENSLIHQRPTLEMVVRCGCR